MSVASSGVGVLRVVTWNVEWAARRKRAAIAARLAAVGADLLVVTEGAAAVMPPGGHLALGGADWGYPSPAERRKVLLWSRFPLTEVRTFDEVLMPPGRVVGAVCPVPEVGPVWVVGVCVPWSGAHVSTGRRDASRWQEHLAFLHVLPEVVASGPVGAPVIVAGDFNQRIPPAHVPEGVAAELIKGLGDVTVVTAGTLAGLANQDVDHIACSRHFVADEVWGVDRVGDGGPLSDHHLVAASLRLR